MGDGWIQRVEEMEDRRQQGRRDGARRHGGHIIGFEISKSVLKREFDETWSSHEVEEIYHSPKDSQLA